MASEDKKAVARDACRVKCSEITTTNHLTAFNALKDLDTEGHKNYRPQHVANLKHMGYN